MKGLLLLVNKETRRPVRMVWAPTSKYVPHQGKRECARRMKRLS